MGDAREKNEIDMAIREMKNCCDSFGDIPVYH